MNLDLFKNDENRDIALYLGTFISNGFLPKITLPTRKSENSSTLIHHIFTKINKGNALAGTLTIDFSDHYLNFLLVVTLNSNDVNYKYITKRDVNLSNVQILKDDLNHSNWENVLQYNIDINSAYNSFVEIYTTKMNMHIPFKKSKFNRKNTTYLLG